MHLQRVRVIFSVITLQGILPRAGTLGPKFPIGLSAVYLTKIKVFSKVVKSIFTAGCLS
jgi:hypothetical protein